MAASENSFEPLGFSLVETVPVIPHTPQRDFKCQRYPGYIQTPHTSPLDIDYLFLQIFRSNGVLFSYKIYLPTTPKF